MALQLKNYDPALMQGASVDINLDLGEILDPAGNEMLEFDQVASAVNFARLANAATGGRPEISSQGDDANVSLGLTPKGTGSLVVTVASPGSAVTVSGDFTVGLSMVNMAGTHAVLESLSYAGTPTLPGTVADIYKWLKIQVDGGTVRYIGLYV